MKLKRTYDYRKFEFDVQGALEDIMCDDGDRGSVEQVCADVARMRTVLARFMALHIKDVDSLNNLAGWQAFIEVQDERNIEDILR